MHVKLRHPSGLLKDCKVGFSWTTFFFGAFVPLFRGDWKWFLIILVLCSITFSLAIIPFWFIYNKLYIKDLLEKGYLPDSDTDRDILISAGYMPAV